jgi:hypothetical protein
MSQTAKTSDSFNYAVIRYLSDAERGITVPVGIALCNTDQGSLQFRFPSQDERIPEVLLATAQPFLQLTEAKIRAWHQNGELPYATEPLAPLSEAWWDQVRKLMTFRVQIGTVQTIDCIRPEDEIETLYEAVVHPQVSQRVSRRRIDGALKQALGKLAGRFQRNQTVPGFGNRGVPVARCLTDECRTLVVEALNFAARDAEKDADAMTSKLERISEAGQDTRFVVGYLASPAGLNGESVLKEWVEHKMHIKLFDLTREETQFRQRVAEEAAQIGDSLAVLHCED